MIPGCLLPVKLNFAALANYPAPARMGVFVLMLLLLWVPPAGLIAWLIGQGATSAAEAQNTASIFTLLLLYTEFIGLIRWWGKHVYAQPGLLQRYGLRQLRRSILNGLTGLGLGLVSVLTLFAVQGGLGWLIWQPASLFLPRLAIEGLLVALGIGFAEELLFRGWVLDELQRDYSWQRSLWVSSVIYAVLHFIKPIEAILQSWLTFPALVVLGVALVWAKRVGQGRLGLAIGLHAGLVWGYYLVNVGQMIQYRPGAPTLLTGLNGNPLEGGLGLGALAAIALALRTVARRQPEVK
jgi:uncharacterized protein